MVIATPLPAFALLQSLSHQARTARNFNLQRCLAPASATGIPLWIVDEGPHPGSPFPLGSTPLIKSRHTQPHYFFSPSFSHTLACANISKIITTTLRKPGLPTTSHPIIPDWSPIVQSIPEASKSKSSRAYFDARISFVRTKLTPSP